MKQQPAVLDFGLALGGGGAKGLSHIPFLAALDEMNVRPRVIAGCSIGAVLGGLYASGMSAREIAARIRSDGIVEAAVQSMRLGAPRGHGLMGRFLRANLPVSDFEDLAIPAIFVASDFWTREQVLLDEGDLVSAICASAAMPGLIKPVVRDGRTLIDGGCVNPVPFDLLTGRAGLVAAINVAGVKDAEANALRPNRRNALFHAFQIMQQVILREKLKSAPVDFLAEPGLRNIRILHFGKADEIMESARDDVERFRAWVAALAERAGHRDFA